MYGARDASASRGPTGYVFFSLFYLNDFFKRLWTTYPVRVGKQDSRRRMGLKAQMRLERLSPRPIRFFFFFFFFCFTFFSCFTKWSLLSDHGWLQTDLPTSHANSRQWTRLETMDGVMPRLRKAEPKGLCYTPTNTTLLRREPGAF